METAKEQQSTGLLDKILPPRLEDAGLEDCALPPDSIKEAFLKAASAVKSRAISILTGDEKEGDCVQDPWPQAKDLSDEVIGGPPSSAIPDTLVVVDTEKGVPGSCLSEKGGGLVEEGGDKVVVGGGDLEEKEEGKECLNDGLKGLKLGDKQKENGGNGDEEHEEKEGKRPILTEGYV